MVVDYEQLFPKPWSQRKTAIIEVALPALLQVMLCAEHAALTPRQKVEKALAEISKQRNKFWGAYGVFTRRRSAIDSVLSGFYDALWDHVAARSCRNRSSSSRASQTVARRSSEASCGKAESHATSFVQNTHLFFCGEPSVL